MKRSAAVVIAALLAACQQQPPSPAPSASATPIVSPTPRASPSDLSRYLGHYPFDRVGSTSFLGDPAVRAAVEQAVADPAIRRFVLSGEGPQTPILAKGDRLLAWGCEAHNCGDHSWTLLVGRDGGAPELCYVDAGEGSDTRPRWFENGAAEARRDACPPAE